MRRKIDYCGVIPSSKSLLNRLLILKSFAPEMVILGDSAADDVVKMKQALRDLSQGVREFDCGSAGTTLRFLALRLARESGRFVLKGHPRLFARPQSELVRILKQLGCQAELTAERIALETAGWQIPGKGVNIDRTSSSQFASAVVLSAWNLNEPLLLRFSTDEISRGYFAMTQKLVQAAGMKLSWPSKEELRIEPGARVSVSEFRAEPDLSSAFAVAALAIASGGTARFLQWPASELQPDAVFAALLEKMGCRIKRQVEEKSLGVCRGESLDGITVSLHDAPDLFPVLAVLCALASSPSRLFGAPHLIHKESNRIEKTAELLRKMGASVEAAHGGLKIIPAERSPDEFSYSCENDHRLAMAAAVARAAGYRVQILNPEVVTKSFPEFWSIAEGTTQC